MPSLGLPAGTFDDVTDDAIWGSPAPAPSSFSNDAPVDVVDDYDVDVNLARKLSARPAATNVSADKKTMTPSDRNQKELFLLGSTFKSDKVTVDYVAVNLTHTVGMNPRVANKLARKLRRNHGSIAISLGVLSDDKCDEMEKALKLRDIDCQSMPVAPSTNTFSITAVQRPPRTTNASMAGGVQPAPPADDYSEARSHNSQTPTPRTGNVRKAFGFGEEQYHQHHQHHSSAASMSSRTVSSRKPNHVAAGAHPNASDIDFGDVTARSRTKGAGPPSSAASVASQRQQQQQSLIFSSGNYDGEKRFGKPHGRGTFFMPGQFSYTGDWAKGNPVGSGYFKLATGEIREGSWNGTNFIETLRYFSKKHSNAPKKTVPSSERSIATKASKRSAIGRMDVVVESKSSPSKSATSSLEGPSLSPESRAENFHQVPLKKESAECAPYMILFKTITKPSALKSGSLSIQGETTVAIMSYDDVGTYEGEWMGGNKDGLPHGMGSFDFSDGTRYYGEFSNGMPSGDGRFTFKDGSVHSRCDHNGILSPNSVPQTPATEASSHPSESSHNDRSPMSNVTMSPVLSTTAKKDEEQIKDDSSDNASDIDIPALNETTKEVADAITFDGESARTSEKDNEGVVVEAIEGNELPSRILPYKRGPSIPNITSFSPKETESVGSDSDYGWAKTETEEKTNEPLVFFDDDSISSVHSPVRGGLNALLQNKLEEDSESVRHLIETPIVLKLDETKQDVMKYLDTVPGKTTSASYVYSEIGTYNGEFSDGCPNGVGTFFWIDGTTYSGNFVEGEPDGDGKLVLPSGEMFVRSAESNEIIHIPAQQKDDVSVANSVVSRISAESVESGEAGKYKGQIVAGVPHGLGTMKFANGTKYTGQWRNGSPAKEGTFYFPNGERHYGRWNGSKFEPIKKEKGAPISAESLIWDDEDVTQSPLPTVEEEEGSGERSCSASVKSGASSSVKSSPRPHEANNGASRRQEKQDVGLEGDSPRLNRAGGVTHLDTDSIGDMSGLESMIASIEMSAFSDLEDASVYSQLSGTSSTPKKSASKKKKKSKFSLTRPKKNDDADAKSLFDEKSASQGETSRNSLPIDIDDASFYSTDDDGVEEDKSRGSSLSSGSAKPKQLRPSKTACLYYNGFTSKCRPYLSSLRCIRLFSTKKSGSLQMDNGKSIAGVTYSGIGEYDGEWQGSMLKGVPHGHGQFSWGDGTRYVGEWDQGIPVGQDGHFVFLDGSICNRGKGIIVVQTLVRGFLARQSIVKQQAKERDEAATTIQSAWRLHDAPHRQRRITAAILIQNIYRSYVTTKASAATRIQTAVRSSTTRADFLEKRSSAILIQKQARRYAARASFVALATACVALQARFRGNLLRKEFEDRYIDVDALLDDEGSVQSEDIDTPKEEVAEETNEEQQPSQLALAAQVYPPECAAYFSSLDLSSVNRKGSLYWNENGKHASLTYTTERVQYNGMWKGSLLDGRPHGEGKMKFSDRTKFYGSFVDGIPTDQGYFKMKNGDMIHSKRIGAIRHEIMVDLLCIGDRLETEFILDELYHEAIETALRFQLEAEDDAIAQNHLELAYLLEEDFIIAEQKKISALEESIKQIEAELAAKRAAEIAALAAFRRSVELQETIARKRASTKIQAVVRGNAGRRLAQLEATRRAMANAATKIQAVVRGNAGRRLAQLEATRRAMANAATKIQAVVRGNAGRRLAQLEAARRAMANDMLKAALRREEEDAVPQDNIVSGINQSDALEENTSSEAMAFRFLSDPTVKANPNTREKISYLHRKGLSFQKIEKAIKELQDETKKAAAAKKATAFELEAEISSGRVDDSRSSSNDNSSDIQSRNTVSTSASSSLSADAPTVQSKKRLFRPSAVAKKVRSAMAGGNKGHEEWAASAVHAMPLSPSEEEGGDPALASFAALQTTLNSVISERND